MAYWLSNTSTLLYLLQRSLKAAGSSGASNKKPPQPTSLFGRMTMVPGSSLTVYPSNVDLHLLDESEHATRFPSVVKKLWIFLVQGFRSSPSSANLAAAAAAAIRQVEAKYPALLFKQQLTAYVEKIYGIIRDNLKKELGSLLSLCIQVS